MKPFFVTATGTDIGKTLLTTTLCWQLRHEGKKVTALKPVITGFDPRSETSDTALILKSCGLAPTPDTMAAISPWRYTDPLAPSLAARKSGAPQVPFAELLGFCREHTGATSDVLLVEGVGGIMSPVDESHTVIDWMRELGWPALLVAGSYLGSISHTLTATQALAARGITLAALVISESAGSEVSLEETIEGIRPFIGDAVPVVRLPRFAASEPWKQQPLISWVVNDA